MDDLQKPVERDVIARNEQYCFKMPDIEETPLAETEERWKERSNQFKRLMDMNCANA